MFNRRKLLKTLCWAMLGLVGLKPKPKPPTWRFDIDFFGQTRFHPSQVSKVELFRSKGGPMRGGDLDLISYPVREV